MPACPAEYAEACSLRATSSSKTSTIVCSIMQFTRAVFRASLCRQVHM